MYVLYCVHKVEQFWAHYCHLARPCELPSHCDIHLFKLGIKPMWEVRGYALIDMRSAGRLGMAAAVAVNVSSKTLLND